jgi:hypothetical protein
MTKSRRDQGRVGGSAIIEFEFVYQMGNNHSIKIRAEAFTDEI